MRQIPHGDESGVSSARSSFFPQGTLGGRIRVLQTMDYPEADEVIRRITELAQSTMPLVVAIDGHSGTGKSTLAACIARVVGATVVDQDDFYSGGSLEDWRALTVSGKVDRVIDWRRVRTQVLEPLRAGKMASWHPFDWESMAGLAAQTISVSPSPIVILDGAYSSRRELADLVDLSILVVLPEDERRKRLLIREGEVYVDAWQSVWDDAEALYFGTLRPPDLFDIVIERPIDDSTSITDIR